MRSILVACLAILVSACVVHTRPGPRTAERRDDRHDAALDRHSRWDKLGERWVDGRIDRDAVPVMRRDRYNRIKLVVEHSAVEIWDVVVVFGNGEVFSPGTRLVFGQGSTSREIDLPGGFRHVQRVEFRYGNLPGGGRAQVEVWGLGARPT
jgi:hypothetical protein